ncbi:MAG: hypothetical protein ACK58T_17875, partial [Phycisphaerae bacterium]
MQVVLLLLSPVLSALAAQAAPVLGPPALLGNVSGVTDTLPQIAYDHAADRYWVVWNANNGTVPGQIHAQMLNGSGIPVGTPIVVRTNAHLTRPAIANIRTAGKFLIGWTEETARRKFKHRSRTTRDPPARVYRLRATSSTRPQPPARTDPRPQSAAFPPREHTAPAPRPASDRDSSDLSAFRLELSRTRPSHRDSTRRRRQARIRAPSPSTARAREIARPRPVARTT